MTTGDNHVHNVDISPAAPPEENLPRKDLTAPANGPVLIVDSTECWAATAQYIPPGWSSAVGRPDRTTPETYLGHSAAVIWGVNDEGGRAWAEAMADRVTIPVYVISLTSAPPHWHLTQGLPPGRTQQQLQAFLAHAATQAVARIPALPPIPGPPIQYGDALYPVGVDVPAEYLRTPKGAIDKVFSNVVVLLRNNQDKYPLTYDQFAGRPCLRDEPLQDQDMREIGEWCQHEGVRVALGVTMEGVVRMAERRSFHPVKKYLEPLVWDGKKRLDQMMTTLAGAVPDKNGLSDFLGRKWMIQAVARIYEPGCQADHTLVLEGEQGLGKSSLFRALFGDKWFTDHLPDLKDKDALIQLRGTWCVEISELATLGRADAAKIKQFLTSPVDMYRDPYGRMTTKWPRTCVFAGTINPGAEGYLKDPTGGRRFWPIPVRGKINIDGIRENRDQLWAEARAAYMAGEDWYVRDEDVERMQQVTTRQAARLEEDPWESAIVKYLATRDVTTTEDILREAIHLSATADWGRTEQARVGRILTGLKWGRKRTKDGWTYYRTERAAPAEQPSIIVESAED